MRCRRLLLPKLSSKRPSWAPTPGAFIAILTSAAELEVPQWKCCGAGAAVPPHLEVSSAPGNFVFCQVQEGESWNTRTSFDL